MTFFKVCFIGLILVMIAMVWMELEETSDRRVQMALLLLALIFHVYTYYVAAKLLIQVEKSSDNIGSTLVALIFLPIGIWFIQPRVNKVFQDNFEAFDPNTPLDHQLDQQPQS